MSSSKNLYPRITYQVNFKNSVISQGSSLPDSLKNALYEASRVKIQIPGIDKALMDGDTFSISVIESTNLKLYSYNYLMQIPNPPPPTPDFNYFYLNNNNINLPVSVQFQDNSTNNPEFWNWNVEGVGPFGNGQYPIYTFEKAGFYQITLNAGNSGGQTSVTKIINVGIVNLNLSVIADQTVNIGNTSTPAVNVTIALSGTFANQAAITATSSDQRVMPNANISVSGRNLILQSPFFTSGSTTITVTASHESETVSTNFNFTSQLNATDTDWFGYAWNSTSGQAGSANAAVKVPGPLACQTMKEFWQALINTGNPTVPNYDVYNDKYGLLSSSPRYPGFPYYSPSGNNTLANYLIWSTWGQLANGTIVEGDPNAFIHGAWLSQIYTRNNNTWVHGLNLSGLSVSNATGEGYPGPWRAGVAITPLHVLGASHYPPGSSNGSYSGIRWLDNQGNLITRTFVNATNTGADTWIGTLNQPLPSTVTPFQILPPLALEYMLPGFGGPQSTNERFIYGFFVDQTRTCFPVIVNTIFGGPQNYVNVAVPNYDGNGNVNYGIAGFLDSIPNSHSLIGGDSGGPFCIILNNNPVLLGCAFGGGDKSTCSSVIASYSGILSYVNNDTYNPVVNGQRTYKLSLPDFSVFTKIYDTPLPFANLT